MKKFVLSFLLAFTTVITAMANGHVVSISSQNNVGCTGSATGSATVTVTGGVGPFTYNWSPGGQTTASVTGLTTGCYTVVATDQNDLSTAQTTVCITQPSSTLNSSTNSLTNIACKGGATGSATITGSGGTPPYTYNWIPSGGTGTDAIGLTAGTYTVAITDMNGCTKNEIVNIVEPSSGLTVITSATDATCGNADGTVSVSASGGTGSLTYLWTNGSTTSYATGLTIGTYTVSVQDSYGCIVTKTATVNSDPASLMSGLTVTDSVYKEACTGTGDGAINITLSGSNPGPFTYQWSNGATTQDITGLSSNSYSVFIYDVGMKCHHEIYQLSANGLNCGFLSGNIFDDKNLNCLNTSGEINLQNIMVVANPGNFKAFTNNQGDYIFNALPYGTYTLSQQISNPYILPTCTSTYTITLSAGNKNIANLNFADTASAQQADVVTHGVLRSLVPGISGAADAYLTNLTYNVPASGTISLILPAGYGSKISSGSSGYTIIGDSVYWTFTNYQSSTTMTYTVFFKPPVGTPLGSVLNACARVIVSGGDLNPINNYSCFQGIVTGSYDPNDKSVSPVGQGPQGDITLADNMLYYHINFQNTGNGPAVNIVIKDTLSDKLDLATFDMTGSSHNYILDVMPGNVLRWKFNNIMLADSGSNQAASHGWVSYRIKQKSSNQVGDQIKNTASIYFDFNPAIVTNTTLNTIATPTSIEESISTISFIQVHPNPFDQQTSISFNKEVKNITIKVVDVVGKEIRHINFSGSELVIEKGELKSGIYFLQIVSANETIANQKMIIQ